jgi:hypothetical protein
VTDILSAVLPVFLIAGVGFAIRKFFPVDLKTLSVLNIYILIPSLVFASLSKRALDWTIFGKVALAALLMVLALSGVLTALARLRKMEPQLEGAFLMTMFANLGNFGLPVVLFAFGEEALSLAVVVMVCGGFLQNSVGLYFAQRSRHNALTSALHVFRFPMIYAFAAALIFQRTGWGLPVPIERAVDITGTAAIPMQLLIVGATLAETRLEVGADVFIATAVRLAGAPAIAFAVSALIGLDAQAARVFILQMSGPVAVGMAVYGVQFDLKPGFLASVVAWTFILSSVSISILLAFLT